MISCQECGKEIGNQAEFCPHCGLSLEKNASTLVGKKSGKFSKWGKNLEIIISSICIIIIVFAFCLPKGSSTVKLSQPSDLKKIIYENDKVIMTFGYDDFITQLKSEEKYVSGHAINLSDSGKRGTKEIFIKEIEVESSRQIGYTIASLLRKGKATLYDRAKGQYLDIIRIKVNKLGDRGMDHWCGTYLIVKVANFATPDGIIFYQYGLTLYEEL